MSNALLSAHYATVRLLIDVHAGLPAHGLLQPTRRRLRDGRRWGLRVPVRGVQRVLAITHAPMLPSAMLNDVGAPVAIISQLNTLPTSPPVNASMATSRRARMTRGQDGSLRPFLYDSFIHNSPLVLSRRTQQPARAGTLFWGPAPFA